ncbi:hypothetical protein GCM10025859_14440 [Alicyclobacillus fastidiosus]|nr:hypothetical protein GCM10025859_14440 [Alicyclobacillus fastidiosus]
MGAVNRHSHCEGICQRHLIQQCLQVEWILDGENKTVVYVSTELVLGSGSVTSDMTPSEEVKIEFLFRDTVIQAIPLLPGQSVAFTVSGFDIIQVVGTASSVASGKLCLELQIPAL